MGMGGMGMGGMGMGGMYGGGMGMGMGGMYGGGMYGGGATVGFPPTQVGARPGGLPGVGDQTGTYLQRGAAAGAQQLDARAPRIVPNPFDNSLLIQGTRGEYESIVKLLRAIDIPPRQVLVEAKIYEITLTGELSKEFRRS
jgi:hypothetical protein